MKNLNEIYKVEELSFDEVMQIEGGLHWGWYAGAFGLGFGTGLAIYAYSRT